MLNFGNLYQTQEGTILGHMLIHGSITEREAFHKYNITCTAQRIYDLRRMGFCIRTEKIIHKNRYGHTSYYARYWLKGFQEKATEDGLEAAA